MCILVLYLLFELCCTCWVAGLNHRSLALNKPGSCKKLQSIHISRTRGVIFRFPASKIDTDVEKLQAYSDVGNWRKAEEVVKEMNFHDHTPTHEIFTLLTKAYLNAVPEKVNEASEVLTEMFRFGFIPSIDLCCVVVEALGRNGTPEKTEAILNRFTLTSNSLVNIVPLYRSVIRAWHYSVNTIGNEVYPEQVAQQICDIFDRLLYIGIIPREEEIVYYIISTTSLQFYRLHRAQNRLLFESQNDLNATQSTLSLTVSDSLQASPAVMALYLRYNTSIVSEDKRSWLFGMMFNTIKYHSQFLNFNGNQMEQQYRSMISDLLNFFKKEAVQSLLNPIPALSALIVSMKHMQLLGTYSTPLALSVLDNILAVQLKGEIIKDYEQKLGTLSEEVLDAAITILSKDKDADVRLCLQLLSVACEKSKSYQDEFEQMNSSRISAQTFIVVANTLSRAIALRKLSKEESKFMLDQLVQNLNNHDALTRKTTSLWNLILSAYQKLFYDTNNERENMEDAILLIQSSMRLGQASPDALTYSLLLAYYLKTSQYEKVLSLSKEIDDLGLTPSLATCYFLLVSQIQSLQQLYEMPSKDSAVAFSITRRQSIQKTVLASFSRLLRTYRQLKIQQIGNTDIRFDGLEVYFSNRPKQENFISVLQAYRILVSKPHLVTLPRDFFDDMLLWISELPMLPLTFSSSDNSAIFSAMETTNEDLTSDDSLTSSKTAVDTSTISLLEYGQPDMDYIIGSMVPNVTSLSTKPPDSKEASKTNDATTGDEVLYKLKTGADLGFEVLQDMRRIRLEPDLAQYVYLFRILHQSVLAKPYSIPSRAMELFNYLVAEKMLLTSKTDDNQLELENQAVELILAIWFDSRRPDNARQMEKIMKQVFALSSHPSSILTSRCFDLLIAAWTASPTPLATQRAEATMSVMRDIGRQPSSLAVASLAKSILVHENVGAVPKIIALIRESLSSCLLPHPDAILALGEACLKKVVDGNADATDMRTANTLIHFLLSHNTSDIGPCDANVRLENIAIRPVNEMLELILPQFTHLQLSPEICRLVVQYFGIRDKDYLVSPSSFMEHFSMINRTMMNRAVNWYQVTINLYMQAEEVNELLNNSTSDELHEREQKAQQVVENIQLLYRSHLSSSVFKGGQAALHCVVESTLAGIWKASNALDQVQSLVAFSGKHGVKLQMHTLLLILQYLATLKIRYPIIKFATSLLPNIDFVPQDSVGESRDTMLPTLRYITQVYSVFAREISEKLPHYAFNHMQQILRLGVQPDSTVLNRILEFSARRRQLSLAERVFFLIFELGFVPERRACRSLLTSLASSDRITADERTYNAFMRMLVAGAPLDGGTLSSLLIALAKSTSPIAIERANVAVDRAKRVGIVIKTSIYNALLNVHAKNPSADAPIRVMKVYEEMRANGVEPDRCTFNILLSSWAASNRPEAEAMVEKIFQEGESLHVEPDVVSYTIRLSMLRRAKRDDVHEIALNILKEMKSKNIEPDEVAWTSLLDVLSKSRVSNREDVVKSIYQQMRESGSKPNSVTYTVLLSMWTQSSDHRASSEIMSLFRDMVASGISYEQATYNSLLLALSKSGDPTAPFKALDIFYSMISAGMVPDTVNMNYLLNLWSNSQVPHNEIVCSILFHSMRLGDLSTIQKVLRLAGEQGETSSNWVGENLIKIYDQIQQQQQQQQQQRSSNNNRARITSSNNNAGQGKSSEVYYESLAAAMRATSELQQEHVIRSVGSRLRPNAQTYTLLLSVWTRSTRPDAIEYLRQLYSQLCKDEIRLDGIGFAALLAALGRIYGPQQQYAAFDEAERLLLVLVNYGVPPASTAWSAFFRAARNDGDRTIRLFRLMVASGVDLDGDTCRLVALNLARLQQGGVVQTIATKTSNNSETLTKVLVPAAMLIEEVMLEMNRRSLPTSTMLANSRLIAWSRLRQQLYLRRQLLQQRQQETSRSQFLRRNTLDSLMSPGNVRLTEDHIYLQSLPLCTDGWPSMTEQDVTKHIIELLREFINQDPKQPYIFTPPDRKHGNRSGSKTSKSLAGNSPKIMEIEADFAEEDFGDMSEEGEVLRDDGFDPVFTPTAVLVSPSLVLEEEEEESELDEADFAEDDIMFLSEVVTKGASNSFHKKRRSANSNIKHPSELKADHVTLRTSVRYFITVFRPPTSLRQYRLSVMTEVIALVEALLEQMLHSKDGSMAARQFFADKDHCHDIIELYLLAAQRIHLHSTNGSGTKSSTKSSTNILLGQNYHEELSTDVLQLLQEQIFARILILISCMSCNRRAVSSSSSLVANEEVAFTDETKRDTSVVPIDIATSLQKHLSNLTFPVNNILYVNQSTQHEFLAQQPIKQGNDVVVSRLIKLSNLLFDTADLRTLRFFLSTLNIGLDLSVYRKSNPPIVFAAVLPFLIPFLQSFCSMVLNMTPSIEPFSSTDSYETEKYATKGRIWKHGVGIVPTKSTLTQMGSEELPIPTVGLDKNMRLNLSDLLINLLRITDQNRLAFKDPEIMQHVTSLQVLAKDLLIYLSRT